MKKLHLATLFLGSILIASLTLTAVSFLSNLDGLPAGAGLEPLLRGQLLQLIRVKEFWALYPALPNATLLFLPGAIILMGPLLGGVFYLMAYHGKYQPVFVSIALLLTAIFPYTIGLLALTGNHEPKNAGVWLAFMLLGVFYAAGACALFSAIQMIKKQSIPA
jgi:hypothetical protein